MRYNSTNQNLQVWKLQSFLSSLPFWECSRLARAVEQACGENVETSASHAKWWKSLVESGLLRWRRWRGVWHCSKPDSGANNSREKWSRTCTCVDTAQHGLEIPLHDSVFLSKARRWLRSISVPQALSRQTQDKNAMGNECFRQRILFTFFSTLFIHFSQNALKICEMNALATPMVGQAFRSTNQTKAFSMERIQTNSFFGKPLKLSFNQE